MAVELAHDIRPDVVIVEGDLTDIPSLEVCRLLRTDPAIGRNVPIILLVPAKPTPEQRVKALRAGAWEFLLAAESREDVMLKLNTCVEAKRNIDAALADGLADAPSGLHNQNGLARRARQLEALMSRMHAPMACVVFELDTDEPDPDAASFITRAARASDIVGELSPGRFGVLAPDTDRRGAAQLASRLITAFGESVADRNAHHGLPPVRWTLRAGYEAVANATYTPFDPAVFIARAASAVRRGTIEAGHRDVRRYTPIDHMETQSLVPAANSSDPHKP